jgi:hypothetical protein
MLKEIIRAGDGSFSGYIRSNISGIPASTGAAVATGRAAEVIA